MMRGVSPGVLRDRYLWLIDAELVPDDNDCAAPIDDESI